MFIILIEFCIKECPHATIRREMEPRNSPRDQLIVWNGLGTPKHDPIPESTFFPGWKTLVCPRFSFLTALKIGCERVQQHIALKIA